MVILAIAFLLGMILIVVGAISNPDGFVTPTIQLVLLILMVLSLSVFWIHNYEGKLLAYRLDDKYYLCQVRLDNEWRDIVEVPEVCCYKLKKDYIGKVVEIKTNYPYCKVQVKN